MMEKPFALITGGATGIGVDTLSTLEHLNWGIDILPLREDGQSDDPSSFVR
jgi:hypothetical protein